MSELKRGVDPLLLIGGIILLAAALTWALPAGRYQRSKDRATGRTTVVAGSYRPVSPSPVGPWDVVRSVPKGLAEAAPVVFYVLLAGGALTVIESTGAVAAALGFIVLRFATRPLAVLPIIAMLFVAGGATYSMYEEIIAFIPILCVVLRRLRMDGITAVAVSLGSAVVAASFSPVNTFLLGISQPVAELPLFSGFGLRCVFFVAALVLWMFFVIGHARRARNAVPAAVLPRDAAEREWQNGMSSARIGAVLVILNLGMAVIVAGSFLWRWDLAEFSAVFLVIGTLAGLAGGLGWRKTSESFAAGFSRLALAAALVGFARAIAVVLDQGAILDTIAQALFGPLQRLPRETAAAAMLAAQSLLTFPMPSDSGRAMVTLPILIPVSDLLVIPRQAAITAFQLGSVFSGIVTPSGGTILAILALAEVTLAEWFRFLVMPLLALTALGALAVIATVAL